MNDVVPFASQGDPAAAEHLLPLVYDELRRLAAYKLAREPSGLTLQPTALVHEAYLRRVNAAQPHAWDSRNHFFAAAAEAMRRILVENARRRCRMKRGGGFARTDLQDRYLTVDEPPDQVLAEPGYVWDKHLTRRLWPRNRAERKWECLHDGAIPGRCRF